MKASEVGTWLGIAGALIGIGIAWGSLNSRIDRLNEKLTEIGERDSNTLCLAVLTRQVVAIEKGRGAVQQKLGALADQYCQDPRNPDVMGLLVPMSPEELERAKKQALQERREFLRKLNEIDRQLGRSPNPLVE